MQKRTPNKLPLDLPTPQIRQRAPDYSRGFKRESEDTDKTASLLRKIFVSSIIIILILILKSIDTDFTQKVVGYVKDGITKDFKVDETLGKLKFVSDYLPDTISVFGQQEGTNSKERNEPNDSPLSFAIPAEGRVIKRFSISNPGIDIQGDKNSNIYAVDQGIVVSVGDKNGSGKYLKIDHGQNVISIYEGCSQVSVDIGVEVAKGDIIASMGETFSDEYILHYETWVDNKAVDPLKFIDAGE